MSNCVQTTNHNLSLQPRHVGERRVTLRWHEDGRDRSHPLLLVGYASATWRGVALVWPRGRPDLEAGELQRLVSRAVHDSEPALFGVRSQR